MTLTTHHTLSVVGKVTVTSEACVCDLTAAAGSRARNLFPPLLDRCCVLCQLQGATEFPLLQGFWQSLATMSPLHSMLCSVSLIMHFVGTQAC